MVRKKVNKDNFINVKLVLVLQYIVGNSTRSQLREFQVVIQVCPCFLRMYWGPELGKEGVSYCAAILNLSYDTIWAGCCISSNIYIYHAGNIFTNSENPLSLQCFNILTCSGSCTLRLRKGYRYFLMPVRSSCLMRKVDAFCSGF